jgi:hypothetical protein
MQSTAKEPAAACASAAAGKEPSPWYQNVLLLSIGQMSN